MATLDKNIPTNLDTDSLKEHLKDWFKNNTDFTGFDFEGSAINTQIDLLVKNTNILAYLAHINSTEIFLDDAQIRRNVVSEAKKLGYVPHSSSAAQTYVDIVVTPSDVATAPSSITLTKDALFLSKKDDAVFYFISPEVRQVGLKDGKYFFENVLLLQGEYKTFSYNVAVGQRKFEIPSTKVDTKQMTVIVRKSINDAISNVYTNVDSIIDVTSQSNVYFISENKNGKFEIEFGNGNIGSTVDAGSYVEIKYLETDGSKANGCSVYTAVSSIGPYSNVTITTKEKAAMGADTESDDSIRFTAPKVNMAQNRAVIADDYSALVKRLFPGVKDVKSWGGDDNNPPVYGTVFMAVQLEDGKSLTTSAKKFIANDIIKKYNVITATPVVVDPDYVDIGISMQVSYDSNKLEVLPSELIDQIRENCIAFNNASLAAFKTKFRTSKFLQFIDNTHSSITNSYIKNITLTKTPYLETGVKQSVVINFQGNVLNKGSVYADGFRVLDPTTTEVLGNVYYLKDDGNSNIHVYRNTSGYEQTVIRGLGTVNYDTGVIALNSFTPLSTLYENTIRVRVSPVEQNINSVNADILHISDKTNITVELVKE